MTMDIKEYKSINEQVCHEQLDNGLHIYVVRKPGYKKAFAMLAADYGSVDSRYKNDAGEWIDSPDGVAHFLEHKIFDMPGGVNALNMFAETGASPNAFTSHSMTAYHFECTSEFHKNLRILLSYVTTPYFTAERVEKEQGIIGQEIRMMEDNPGWVVYVNLLRALYKSRVVQASICGTVESIAEITDKVLYECHGAFYRPSNMVLCVSGDVVPSEVFSIAREMLGGKPDGAAAKRDYGKEPQNSITPRMEATLAVSMPQAAIGFKLRSPEKGQGYLRHTIVSLLASKYLAGPSSPLYERLYEKGLIDRSFEADNFIFSAGSVLMAFYESTDPDAVYEAILSEAEEIANKGIDDARFTRLLRAQRGERLRMLDSPGSICREQCAAHFRRYDPMDFTCVYDTVTPEELRSFFRDNLTKERAAISVVRPTASGA